MACDPQSHKRHMCEMKKSGFDKSNQKEFAAMTDKPAYRCGNCGAEANQAENVCKPVKM